MDLYFTQEMKVGPSGSTLLNSCFIEGICYDPKDSSHLTVIFESDAENFVLPVPEEGNLFFDFLPVFTIPYTRIKVASKLPTKIKVTYRDFYRCVKSTYLIGISEWVCSCGYLIPKNRMPQKDLKSIEGNMKSWAEILGCQYLEKP